MVIHHHKTEEGKKVGTEERMRKKRREGQNFSTF
jgi:hypothetical protein